MLIVACASAPSRRANGCTVPESPQQGICEMPFPAMPARLRPTGAASSAATVLPASKKAPLATFNDAQFL